MSYATNKPLNEYGDLSSMHHLDKQAQNDLAEAEIERRKQPPQLITYLSIGGSYTVQWTHGDEELPRECMGIFTGKKQAEEAIFASTHRLANELEARQEKEKAAAQRAQAAERKAPTKKAASKAKKADD